MEEYSLREGILRGTVTGCRARSALHRGRPKLNSTCCEPNRCRGGATCEAHRRATSPRVRPRAGSALRPRQLVLVQRRGGKPNLSPARGARRRGASLPGAPPWSTSLLRFRRASTGGPSAPAVRPPTFPSFRSAFQAPSAWPPSSAGRRRSWTRRALATGPANRSIDGTKVARKLIGKETVE